MAQRFGAEFLSAVRVEDTLRRQGTFLQAAINIARDYGRLSDLSTWLATAARRLAYGSRQLERELSAFSQQPSGSVRRLHRAGLAVETNLGCGFDDSAACAAVLV
jgi:hypothetical protein